MTELSIEEIKERSVKLLLLLDEFCKKNSINYSLGEGTLIGAIRHKGFIPWDDDIDVLMCREDYEKFISSYNSIFGLSHNSKVISIHNDKKWHRLFSRLVDTETFIDFELLEQKKFDCHGLWIDIFPVDNAPTKIKPLYNMVRRARFLYSLESCRTYHISTSLIKRYLKLCLRGILLLFPSNYFSKKAEDVLKTYFNKKTKKKGSFSYIWHDPYIFSCSVFDDYIEAEFEGEKFKVARGYDEYLRVQYGDYMQLPPVEKRVADHHPFKAYLITSKEGC